MSLLLDTFNFFSTYTFMDKFVGKYESTSCQMKFRVMQFSSKWDENKLVCTEVIIKYCSVLFLKYIYAGSVNSTQINNLCKGYTWKRK